MQVTETSSEGLKREFQVVIPAETINGEVDARLTQLAPTIQMPGFRPGKVPVALLKKRYGPSVMGEVLEKTVNETSQKTLEERDLRAATQPQIEITKFDEGGDLEFSMVVDIMPEITPIDFSTLELERLTAEPGDSDLDEAIGKLASQHKSSEPIKRKRKSKSGDSMSSVSVLIRTFSARNTPAPSVATTDATTTSQARRLTPAVQQTRARR